MSTVLSNPWSGFFDLFVNINDITDTYVDIHIYLYTDIDINAEGFYVHRFPSFVRF